MAGRIRSRFDQAQRSGADGNDAAAIFPRRVDGGGCRGADGTAFRMHHMLRKVL
jgi:hypothetical protein